MKRLLITALVFVSVLGVNAQVYDGANHGFMLLSTKEDPTSGKLEGSPYLNENFQYGTASVDGKEPIHVYLRFNVAEDQMEVKTDPTSEEIYVLPMSKKAVYMLDGKKYAYNDIVVDGEKLTGYFIEHYNGEKARLLEKPAIEVREAVEAKTGYGEDQPARIRIYEEFFIVQPSGEVVKVDVQHRDIKDVFGSKEQKAYLKDNRIRDIEDLKAFVAFLDED